MLVDNIFIMSGSRDSSRGGHHFPGVEGAAPLNLANSAVQTRKDAHVCEQKFIMRGSLWRIFSGELRGNHETGTVAPSLQ